jgi:hypothetical protein
LLGRRGILPAARFFDLVAEHSGGRMAGFWQLPSVFWISATDACLQGAAWLGLGAGLAMLAGFANAPLLALAWALYLSFAHVGQIFYGYGWDSLLCETGFLAIFIAPSWRPREFDARSPPPLLVIILLATIASMTQRSRLASSWLL